jgi:hypothetical protein
MTTNPASAHDQENPQPPSRVRHPGQVVWTQEDSNNPARKATRSSTVPPKEPSPAPSRKDALDARIMRRANELAHHRGGHNDQNLHDWLIAAREVLSEES